MAAHRRITLAIVALVLLLARPVLTAAQEASPVAPKVPTGIPEDPLYTITLPADALPRWDRVTISLSHFTIPAGTASTWEARAGACCPGPKLKYILAGTLRVVSEGPLQVVRGGSPNTVETLPAGTEVVLAVGDTVITRNEYGDTWVNPGPEPVELLSTPVLAGRVPGPPVPPNWTPVSYDVQEDLELTPSAYTLRLGQRTVTTSEDLPPLPNGFLFVLIRDNDAPIFLGRGSDGVIMVLGEPDTTVAVYVLTVEPAVAGTGTPIAGMGP